MKFIPVVFLLTVSAASMSADRLSVRYPISKDVVKPTTTSPEAEGNNTVEGCFILCCL